MKNVYILGGLLLLLGIGYIVFVNLSPQVLEENNYSAAIGAGEYRVQPIEHASFLLNFGGVQIANDPVGELAEYGLAGTVPDLILLSDVHQDHLSIETLEAMVTATTTIIAPQAVFNELPERLAAMTVVMGNDDAHSVADIKIRAMPMYNLPESADAFHVKGAGNGYLLTQANTTIYIAGDTADIPEMRALTDIDVAFIPMNMPFTMDVETAADAVLEFVPKLVYPYHYRGSDGLADVERFKTLVTEANSNIEVVLLEWY